jgi:hypothetical protein
MPTTIQEQWKQENIYHMKILLDLEEWNELVSN